jgi:hypothetical protein
MSNEYINNNIKLLDDYKNQKEEIIKSFNEISYNMANHLAKEFKESIFGRNITLIKNIFKFRPNEIIIMFMNNIYVHDNYRQQIKAKNENFFMTQTYDDIKTYESHIFEFKDIWSKMSNNTKMIVKDSMLMLVEHCELYINVLAELNKLKKIK